MTPDQIQKARATPIEQVLARRGYHLKQHGRRYLIGPCPVCGGADRFNIKDNRLWLCRHCKADRKYGDVIDLVMHIDGCPAESDLPRSKMRLAL